MLSGILDENQSDFMDLIFEGRFTDAILVLNANPELDINFYTDHPDYPQLQGISPLMMSCYFGEYDLSAALLKRGAKVDATDLGGKTALHYAVVGTSSPSQTAREDLIYLLATLKRDLLTVADSFGNMPIHLAAKQGRMTVQTLLKIEESLKYVRSTKENKLPMALLVHGAENEAFLRALLSAKAPSLEFQCASQIAISPMLREGASQLPAVLQEKVALYTPSLAKWLENLKSQSTVEISQRLSKLQIT
ncbi:MAG: hypothetical protein AB7V32_10630 [Candidatus Berkiella sp.]